MTDPREPATSALLRIEGLAVEIPTADGIVRAVDGVSLVVQRGETLALVGESGSGKTMTALAVMGLVPHPGRVTASQLTFDGRDLRATTEHEYEALRGGDLAMIFQDPLSALNPSHRVGDQVAEAIRLHRPTRRATALEQASALLDRMGIPRERARGGDFPHELSGGMRQRVMIAMAIANAPKLLIADEPTTALDVTIQAQVLDVLRVAQRETGAAVLIITHDLGIVAGIADRVAVMYAGRVVEEGSVDEIFADPRHPYTAGLLGSIPRVGTGRPGPLRTIRGSSPGPYARFAGCPFAPRCEHVIERCHTGLPELLDIAGSGTHRAACVRAADLPALLRTGRS